VGAGRGRRSLKEANGKAPAELKTYTDCMDYYRSGSLCLKLCRCLPLQRMS